MYDKILVGTDLSPTAAIAVDHAAALASRLGSVLTLVHAGRGSDALDTLGREHSADVIAEEGHPAEVLLQTADRTGADLVVVGSVGMSGAKRFAIGNVPNKISHHIDRDLLIVKTDAGERPADYDRILVGTDGSDTALRAVEMSSRLAAALSAALSIVTVYEALDDHELKQLRAGIEADAISAWGATRSQRDTPSGYQWRIAGAAQANDILERAAERAARSDVEPDLRAEEGKPAEVLLSIAGEEDIDLICVGSVGMSGAARFSLGNVPHRLSHHSPTNILILKTRG